MRDQLAAEATRVAKEEEEKRLAYEAATAREEAAARHVASVKRSGKMKDIRILANENSINDTLDIYLYEPPASRLALYCIKDPSHPVW